MTKAYTDSPPHAQEPPSSSVAARADRRRELMARVRAAAKKAAELGDERPRAELRREARAEETTAATTKTAAVLAAGKRKLAEVLRAASPELVDEPPSSPSSPPPPSSPRTSPSSPRTSPSSTSSAVKGQETDQAGEPPPCAVRFCVCGLGRAAESEHCDVCGAVEFDEAAELEQPPPSAAKPRSKRRGKRLIERINELRARRQERHRRKEQQWHERYLDKQRNAGNFDPPPNIPRELYMMAQDVVHNAHRVRHWLRVYRGKAGTCYALERLRAAAMRPRADGSGWEYDYSDAQTRRVIAIGLLLLSLASRTRRSKDLWKLHVRGVSIEAIAGCLHSPGNPKRRPNRNTIGGGGRKREDVRESAAAARWRGRARVGRTSSWKPDMQLLRDVGFCYAQQLPPEVVERSELGRSRRDGKMYARNRYWIQAVPLVPTGELEPEHAALHAVGWDWADEEIRTPGRCRSELPERAPP